MELFRPDAPINSKEADKFQRYSFASHVAKIVSTGKFPAANIVGIYGKRGGGNTSILNCIQREIGDNAVTINFNPWFFNDDYQLIKEFFRNIAIAIGKNVVSKSDQVIKLLNNYADSMSLMANLCLPLSMFTPQEKIEARMMNESVGELKEKVDNLIIDSGRNIVVIIDDIDKLIAQDIYLIFLLVKLASHLPQTAYVLSFDEEIVANTVGPKIASKNIHPGYDYLEKIIPKHLRLPKADEHTIRKFALGLLNNSLSELSINLENKEGEDFVTKFDKVFLSSITTPRLAVQYSNAVAFSVPLLHGEVNTVELMMIEGIKIFCPKLHSLIKENPGYFLGLYNFEETGNEISAKTKNKTADSISKTLNQYPTQKDNLLILLNELFPQLKSVYDTHYDSEGEQTRWHNEKRVCSPQHFERYFSYSVQEGDVPDINFNKLIKDLN